MIWLPFATLCRLRAELSSVAVFLASFTVIYYIQPSTWCLDGLWAALPVGRATRRRTRLEGGVLELWQMAVLAQPGPRPPALPCAHGHPGVLLLLQPPRVCLRARALVHTLVCGRCCRRDSVVVLPLFSSFAGVNPIIDALKTMDANGHYAAFFKNGFVEARQIFQFAMVLVAAGMVAVFATQPVVIVLGRAWQLVASLFRRSTA